MDEEGKSYFLEIVKLYYNYLTKNDITYAKLALDVVENKGEFGRFVNLHLKHQSKFDGVPEDQIPLIRDKIIINLAYRDAKMRVSKPNISRDVESELISNYHKDVLGTHSSPYACGGLLADQVLGPRKLIDLCESGGFLKGIMQMTQKILSGETIQSEYSIERMFRSAIHTSQILKGPEVDFCPSFLAHSKEMAAKSFDVDISRIEEVPSSMSDMSDGAMVKSRSFKVKPASSWNGPSLNHNATDSTSSSESSEEEDDDSIEEIQNRMQKMPGFSFEANKRINELIQNPEKLARFQEEAMKNAYQGIENFCTEIASGDCLNFIGDPATRESIRDFLGNLPFGEGAEFTHS